MFLDWSSESLKDCCFSRARLREIAGDQAAAAEDLLHLVSHAPTLTHLGTLRSLRIDVDSGGLTLSMEEVEMRAHTLGPDGTTQPIANQASLLEHASSEALRVDDLHVRGRSILRHSS